MTLKPPQLFVQVLPSIRLPEPATKMAAELVGSPLESQVFPTT